MLVRKLLKLRLSILRRVQDSHPELPINPDVSQPGKYRWPLYFAPQFILVIFVGGFVGAYARHELSLAIPTATDLWPLATFLTNIVGAFLLGFLLEALVRRGPDEGRRQMIRLGVGTGFIGAFTTYSTFAVETALLLEHHFVVLSAAYITVTVVVGIVFSALGIKAAAKHHKRTVAKR